MGVVFLVDGHSHPVGPVGELGYGVYDEAVVPLAVAAGNHIQTVTNLEKSTHVVLIGQLVAHGAVIHAELVSHLIQLSHILGVQCGHDAYGGIRPADVLAVCKHIFHALGGLRGPGAVFDKGNGALLIAHLLLL